MQKSLVIVFDSRQATTLRVAQYKKGHRPRFLIGLRISVPTVARINFNRRSLLQIQPATKQAVTYFNG